MLHPPLIELILARILQEYLVREANPSIIILEYKISDNIEYYFPHIVQGTGLDSLIHTLLGLKENREVSQLNA